MLARYECRPIDRWDSKKKGERNIERFRLLSGWCWTHCVTDGNNIIHEDSVDMISICQVKILRLKLASWRRH